MKTGDERKNIDVPGDESNVWQRGTRGRTKRLMVGPALKLTERNPFVQQTRQGPVIEKGDNINVGWPDFRSAQCRIRYGNPEVGHVEVAPWPRERTTTRRGSKRRIGTRHYSM
jgi:hypothetical protein